MKTHTKWSNGCNFRTIRSFWKGNNIDYLSAFKVNWGYFTMFMHMHLRK